MLPDLAIAPVHRSIDRQDGHGDSEPAVRGPDGEKLDFELLYSDGVPLDTIQHRLQMNLLIELTELLMTDRGRVDYFTAGDTFLYYSVEQARFMAENAPLENEPPSNEYRELMGPDYFFVDGAPWRNDRKVWITWQENHRYPQVIVELTSPSTAKIDRTIKKRRYEGLFKTAEYYMYRPTTKSFESYHLGPKGRYRKAAEKPAIPGASTISDTWVWSDRLGVWLGLWEGRFHRYQSPWLRFYDTDGRLIATERERTDAARERANAAQERADAAQERADAAQERAETERERADAAEAELERLRALLADRS